MKMIDDVIIIGIDSGYGNIKTANCCFPASLSAYDREPVFKENLLVFEGKFYLIGEGHKEFLADKTKDLDYYVLALAAIARELNIRKMTCGKIRIAAGLPLTWVSGQRDEFRDYLLQNKAVDFSFRNVSYHVEIVGVDVFPQGFAAVADRLSDFRGVNMICDIGNGTMNIMFINDKKPVSGNMFTEKYGTHQCLLAVRENVMRAHHTTVDEAIINRVFRFGTADIKEAARRGLPNLPSMVSSVPSLTTDKAVQLFGKFGVFTRAELESRSEIMYETYTKVISIEARTMLHMAGKHYIPAVVRNCTRLADSVCKVHTACPAAPTGVQETLLCQTSELLTKAASAEHHLEGLVEQLGRMDNVHDMAVFCHDMIMPAMQDLRDPIDRLELIVDKDIWPVPTYGDLMFEV